MTRTLLLQLCIFPSVQLIVFVLTPTFFGPGTTTQGSTTLWLANCNHLGLIHVVGRSPPAPPPVTPPG